ncbi:MAG: hypothetical protein ACOYM2_10535, partial [Rectinemataceae bacterium]
MEGKVSSSETRDAFGRLLSFGQVEAQEVPAEEQGSTPIAAPGTSTNRATAPSPGVAGQAAAKAGVASPPSPAPPPGPLDSLTLTSLRYDEAGRVIEVSRRRGSGDPDSVITRSFSSDGQLDRVEFSRAGKVEARLFLAWEGSGRGASARLFDASGKQKSFAHIFREGQGDFGLTVGLSLLGPADEDAGWLSLAWDSAGRLTQWRVDAPALAAPAEKAKESAGTSAAKLASAGPVAEAVTAAKAAPIAAAVPSAAKGAVPDKAAVPAKEGSKADMPADVGIPELLFPLWPGDAASMEAFAAVSGPFPHGDTRSAFRALAASGFSSLPFGRPPFPDATSPEGSGAAESTSAASPAEGTSIDFLWDGSGRLLESHQRKASGQIIAFISCRYDGRGLLVETRSLAAPAEIKAPAASSKPAAATEAKPAAATEAKEPELRSFSYRVDATGSWVEASVFLRQGTAESGYLKP